MKEIYVYVAGPLNSSGRQAQNTRRAVDMAAALFQAGFIPVVPHLYAAQWAFLCPDKESADWLSLDFAWLRRCDVVVRLFGKSEGAEMEEEHAKSLGIPVLYQEGPDEPEFVMIQRLRGMLSKEDLCGNE